MSESEFARNFQDKQIVGNLPRDSLACSNVQARDCRRSETETKKSDHVTIACVTRVESLWRAIAVMLFCMSYRSGVAERRETRVSPGAEIRDEAGSAVRYDRGVGGGRRGQEGDRHSSGQITSLVKPTLASLALTWEGRHCSQHRTDTR